MYGKPVRRIGDGYVDNVTPETVKEDILLLLDDIHGFYKAALDRLPVKRMPALAPCLLKAGVGFGFLDPVSNIILNTIAYLQRLPSTESQQGATRNRKSIFSKISTDTRDRRIFRILLPRHMANAMTIARLSLEGLVSFLLFHFRYLAETEALRYLRLARADLLAAVHLIDQDRNKSCSASSIAKIHNKPVFDITSPTSKIALECAATSARHPEPAILVNASLSAVSRLSKVSNLLQVHRLPPRTIRRLELLLRREPKVMDQMAIRRPLNLAGSRLRDGKEVKRDLAGSMVSVAHGKVEIDVTVTFRYTESLKLLLLDKIHMLYLEALSKLPRDSLRKQHHCNLLRAGYCYGLMEPVSNILWPQTISRNLGAWKQLLIHGTLTLKHWRNSSCQP
uniref:PIR2-like helical domain-containing protein n=1 Tax=Triticum aestivum TaxID=4565 RepID=A0A3B6EI24_WHEAT